MVASLNAYKIFRRPVLELFSRRLRDLRLLFIIIIILIAAAALLTSFLGNAARSFIGER